MFKSLYPLCAAALFVWGTALSAQTTETQGDSSPQLDLGEPVDGPQLGERYTKETYGDWLLSCIRTTAEVDPCSMRQILTDDRDTPTAEVSMFRLEQGGQAVAGGTIVVPLETLLPAQITIAVDGAGGKRYGYSFCNQIGCVAQVGFTQEDIDAFRAGRTALLTIVPAPAPDQPVVLEMSLSGFTAAYEVVDIVSGN